jgi:hypothetical protein
MRFDREFNFGTREWIAIEQGLKEDLQAAVDQLCNPETDQTTTDNLRGRIRYIKDLLLGATAAVRERQR